MPIIATYVNWKQYHKFREIAEKLGKELGSEPLCDYATLKTIVLEALKRKSAFFEKSRDMD